MRISTTGVLASLVLVACSGSGSPAPSTGSSAPSSPVVTPTPGIAAQGFCADRPVIGDVYREIRAGTIGYRAAAASVTAAGKVMRADADLAPTAKSAYKMRQFALVLNTLRLAILGAAENYPGDFSVRQFTSSLPGRVVKIADEIGCPA